MEKRISVPVHKTILHTKAIAIENIDGLWAALSVHLNEFSWTHAERGGEAQA